MINLNLEILNKFRKSEFRKKIYTNQQMTKFLKMINFR